MMSQEGATGTGVRLGGGEGTYIPATVGEPWEITTVRGWCGGEAPEKAMMGEGFTKSVSMQRRTVNGPSIVWYTDIPDGCTVSLYSPGKSGRVVPSTYVALIAGAHGWIWHVCKRQRHLEIVSLEGARTVGGGQGRASESS